MAKKTKPEKPKRKVGRPAGGAQLASDADKRKLAERAQDYAKEIIDNAVDIMRNSTSDAARMAAINFLADRGYGRAIQAVQIDDPNDNIGSVVSAFSSFAAALNAIASKRLEQDE